MVSKKSKKFLILTSSLIASSAIIGSITPIIINNVSNYNVSNLNEKSNIKNLSSRSIMPRAASTSCQTNFTIPNQTADFSCNYSDKLLLDYMINNNIITGMPKGATVKIVDRGLDIGKIGGLDYNKSVDNIRGRIRFKISVSPYYDSNGTLNNGTLTLPNTNKSSPNDFIYAYGFRKFNSKQILFNFSYNQPIVKYDDGTSKSLFEATVGRFKFYSDWKNPAYLQAIADSLYNTTNLGDYTATSYFFSEASSYTRIRLDKNTLVLNNTKKTAAFDFTWFGYYEGDAVWNKKGNLTIALKDNPTTNDDVFVQFGNYLQGWINTNYRFPNNTELKQITVDYLNKVKDLELPVDWIPGGLNGKFTVNDISLNKQPIINDEYTISNGNPLKQSTASLDLGAISIINPIKLDFPSYKLTIPTTYLKAQDFSVSNDKIISALLPSYIPYSANNQLLVEQWINTQIKNGVIFQNVSKNSIVKPNSLKFKFDSKTNKLNANFILTNTYISNNVACDKTFSINLINFNNSSTKNKTTSFKYQVLKWNDPMFSNIFGANDKAFAIDWNQPNELSKRQKLFFDYINAHINDFFLEPYQTTIKSINTFNLNVSTGIIDVDFTYNGIQNGVYIDQINQKMSIELRLMPTNTDINDLHNAFGLIKKAIQLYCDQNSKAPSDYIIAEIVVYVINELNGANEIADYYLPANRKITLNDVLVRSSSNAKNATTYIERYSSSMYIWQGAITLNPAKTNELVFPDLGLFEWDVVLNYRSAWEQWIKYVVISCGIALVLALIICFIIFVSKKRSKQSLEF